MGMIYAERNIDGTLKGLYDGGVLGRDGCPPSLALVEVDESSQEVRSFVQARKQDTVEKAIINVLLAIVNNKKPSDLALNILNSQ